MLNSIGKFHFMPCRKNRVYTCLARSTGKPIVLFYRATNSSATGAKSGELPSFREVTYALEDLFLRASPLGHGAPKGMQSWVANTVACS
jgi:hypothetical protein